MATIDYSKRTIGAVVEDKARMLGDKTFLIFGDQQISYAKMNENANKVANALADMGVKKGDNVIIISPICPEYIHAWFGLAKLGAIEVTLNDRLRGSLLRHEIDFSDAEIIMMDHSLAARIGEIEAELKNLKRAIVWVGGQGDTAVKPKVDLTVPVTPWSDLLSFPDTAPKADVRHYDPYNMQYTSGTTGPPKACLLPHNMAIHYCELINKYMKTTGDDVVWNFFPLYNLTGQLETTFEAFLAGARLVYTQGWDPKTFWDTVRKQKITQTWFYGRVLAALLNEPPSLDDRNHTLRVVSAVPCPADLDRQFRERFGTVLLEVCGMTEVGITNYRPLDDPRFGSAGPANCGVDVKIFDDEDNELSPGQIGEIVYRPQKPYIMFFGYHKMPEVTVKMWRNFWAHSGDLGVIDQEGWLYFKGRKGERIRTKGFVINAPQVEEILNKHPKVMETAVIGVKAEYGEEEVMAFVVPREGQKVVPEELMQFCEKEMPYYMVPRYIEFREKLPKTEGTLRVTKDRLREEGVSERTWDRKKAGYELKR
ncbi:MAG: AMP-binding protein [Chloroflexota bacterium]